MRRLLLLSILLLGIALRLIWLGDMEYKGDERRLFEVSQHNLQTGEWPRLGMVSSTGTRNPAMSDWIFIALTRIGHLESPPALCLAVRILNSLALILLLGFALYIVPRESSEAWLWAFAFACANPFNVLLQRKIWAQSVLPFFCVLWLIGIYRRHTRWGALLAGFVGLLMAQIHMSGFFFYAAVAGVLLVWDRKSVRWGFFGLGAVLAIPPLLPWISEWNSHREPFHLAPMYGWGEVLRLRFWRYWFTEPLGIKLTYSLGDMGYGDFLRFPYFGAQATHLVALLHLAIAGVGLTVYGKGAWALAKGGKAKLLGLWKNRDIETLLFVASGLVYGALLSAYTINNLIYRHYLMILYPLTLLFFVRICLKNFSPAWAKKLLGTHLAALVALSFLFLSYIHAREGTTNADADYGLTYQKQLQHPGDIDQDGRLRPQKP